jgi:hypothetical protein
MYVRLVLAWAIASCSTCALADLSNKELIKACDDRTIVVGRENGKLVKAGETVSGFCAGYVQATLEALKSSASCKPQGEDAPFLLSVYTQYMKDKKVPESAGASQTLTQAIRRIAQCK